MSLSSDKELGELSSGDSDVDDLFNSYNKYYTASFSSPQCSPISSKYTGVPTRFQYTEPRRSPESQLHEFQALEIGQGTFSEQDTLQEQWLTEFGKEKYQLPSNLNIFSKQQIRERWVQFWDKLRETEKSVLQGMKRGRWNEISNEFTDFKAIKMANLAFLTGKESDGVKLPVVQPGNYLENKFTFLAFINSPGYAEYIFDYYQKYHPVNFLLIINMILVILSTSFDITIKQILSPITQFLIINSMIIENIIIEQIVK